MPSWPWLKKKHKLVYSTFIYFDTFNAVYVTAIITGMLWKLAIVNQVIITWKYLK